MVVTVMPLCFCRFLDEVTEVTFDLLVTSPNVSSGMQKPLTPSHYLAVIDPKALWFKTWMVRNINQAESNFTAKLPIMLLKPIDEAVNKSV